MKLLLSRKCPVWNIIWGKVFKNGPRKICERQPLKNFTWSILEYFVPYVAVSVTSILHLFSFFKNFSFPFPDELNYIQTNLFNHTKQHAGSAVYSGLQSWTICFDLSLKVVNIKKPRKWIMPQEFLLYMAKSSESVLRNLRKRLQLTNTHEIFQISIVPDWPCVKRTHCVLSACISQAPFLTTLKSPWWLQ